MKSRPLPDSEIGALKVDGHTPFYQLCSTCEADPGRFPSWLYFYASFYTEVSIIPGYPAYFMSETAGSRSLAEVGHTHLDFDTGDIFSFFDKPRPSRDDTKPYLRLQALILPGFSSVGDGDIVGRAGAESWLLSALAGGVNSGIGITLNEAKDCAIDQLQSPFA